MNIQNHIENLMKQQREKSFAESPQITLGQLISELESLDLVNSQDNYKTISFDFGSAIPTILDSWRGSYSELALGYKLTGYDKDSSDDHLSETCSHALLQELKSAIGKEYSGWKGGDYTMDKNTPLWVSNSGNSGHTAIIGAIDSGWQIVILTCYCEY